MFLNFILPSFNRQACQEITFSVPHIIIALSYPSELLEHLITCICHLLFGCEHKPLIHLEVNTDLKALFTKHAHH